MDAKMSKGIHAEPLSDKHILRTYNTVPSGGILEQQAKKRVYFDSGDSALSAANKMTENGAVQTGTVHPARESISHPYAPVPSASNVTDNANEGFNGKISSTKLADSPLSQGTESKEEGVSDSKGTSGMS